MALRDDNINLHINVGTTAAQEEIRQLTQESRELEKANKEVRLELQKLKAQGKENTDEFKNLEAVLKSNNSAIAANKKEIKELEKGLSLNDMTMNQLRKRAKELQSQLNNTVQSADPKGYADLQKQLEAVNKRMTDVKGAGKSLGSQLSAIPGPAGKVSQGVIGINSAMKMLLANPIIAILAAVVMVFMALSKAMKSSEEATNKLNKVLAPLKAVIDGLLWVVQKCVGAIIDFVSAIINGLMKALEKLPFVGKYFKELNDAAAEAIKLEEAKQALAKRERDAIEENAKIERDVAKLRTKAKQKDLYTEKERIAFIEEAIRLEKERADENLAMAKERLRIAEAEAARAENTKEQEEELAQLRAEVYKAEQEYFDRTRRLEGELTGFKADEERKRKEEAKKALEARIKSVESEIAQEKSKLIQARLNREIDDKELNKRLQQLELQALEKRLTVRGLEKEKVDEINREILQVKLKYQQQEEAATKDLTEKIRIDLLTKGEKELDDIRKKQAERLKLQKEALDKGLIKQEEYEANVRKIKEEAQKETDEKLASQELKNIDKRQEDEKLKLLQQYADKELSQEEYQQRLLELEDEFLEERLRLNGLTEEQITKLKEQQLKKQIALQEKHLKEQQALLKKQTTMMFNFASQVGDILGDALTNAEVNFADVMGDILLLALDALRQTLTLAITQTTIRNIAEFGSLVGLPKAAAEIALINAAYGAVKNLIKRPSKNTAISDTNTSTSSRGAMVVNQRADGKYDVIGREDGRLYREVPFIGETTGIVRTPALIAERGEELVVSSPHLQLLKRHINYPYIVSAIQDVRNKRVTQRAEDNYESLDTPVFNSPEGGISEEALSVLSDVKELLYSLKTEGVKALIGISEFEAKQQLIEDSRKIGSLK